MVQAEEAEADGNFFSKKVNILNKHFNIFACLVAFYCIRIARGRMLEYLVFLTSIVKPLVCYGARNAKCYDDEEIKLKLREARFN